MSKRNKRFEVPDLDPVPKEEVREEVSKVPEIPKISFSHWFDKMLKAGKVRHYQDEALLVFFKKRGLKNTEIEDRYNEAFKNF